MGARFTAGASVAETKKIGSQNPRSRSADGNTMKGLRGFIKTKQDTSSSGLASSKGFGPKREGPINTSKSSKGRAKFETASFGGSSDKSYYGSSTASPGKVVSNKGTPSARKAVDQRDSGRRPGNNKAPMEGRRGTMESLRGKTR